MTPGPLNRRQFLGSSARNAATAAVGVVGLSQVKPATARDSNAEPVRIGLVGLRNQGSALLRAFAQTPGCTLAALCDVDESHTTKALQLLEKTGSHSSSPLVTNEFRHLLDGRTVDAVVIATPDHHHAWMTALACAAGKDVYLEVPTTHTLEQAASLRQMIRSSGVIVQTGLQHRSGSHYRSAIELLHSGELGAVRFARAWACQPRQPLQRPPSGSQGNSLPAFAAGWLGDQQAPALHPADWHFHWRWLWDFGSGELGTWGTSLLDLARWGLQVNLPQRVSATGGCLHLQDGRETPDTLSVQYDFGDATIAWEHRQWGTRGIEGRPQGVAFYAERGVLIVDRSGWKVYDRSPALAQPASESLLEHTRNFIEAVQQRSTPTAPFEVGCLSSQLCHLGNLAYRHGGEWRAGVSLSREA